MPAEEPASERRMPIGLMVVGSEMASFTILGLLLDFALGTMPGFTIGLTLLGLAVAFFHLVQMSKALSAKKSGLPGSPSQQASPPAVPPPVPPPGSPPVGDREEAEGDGGAL
jgi:hypothetical protein